MRTSYKWKMIKTGTIKFEIERALFKKGKLDKKNELLEIEYIPGAKVDNYKALKKISGSYKFNISQNGLTVIGKVHSSNIDIVFLKIDNITIKKITVTDKTRFSLNIKKHSLAKFPINSILIIELEDGTKFVYEKSDNALLTIPFGNGTLEGIIEEGFFLSKKGTMAASNKIIEHRREKYLDLYLQVKNAFDEDIGTPLFLTYGTLLGHTREGDFIANDDDFDAGYISYKSNPKEVKKETLDIILKLLRLGFNVSVNPVGRLFKIHKKTGVHLDLMPVWFEDGWNIAFRGACVKSSVEDYLPAKKGLLRNHEVNVPKTPEVFLSGYYGKNWETPDPGYVSNFEQTGKVLLSNYFKFLLTPLEFKKLSRIVELEKGNNPDIGNFTASALKGIF